MENGEDGQKQEEDHECNGNGIPRYDLESTPGSYQGKAKHPYEEESDGSFGLDEAGFCRSGSVIVSHFACEYGLDLVLLHHIINVCV